MRNSGGYAPFTHILQAHDLRYVEPVTKFPENRHWTIPLEGDRVCLTGDC